MARIEWIKQRLHNWALWKAKENASGLGYAGTSILLAERVDCDRTTHLPIDESDAAITDTAVTSLKLGKGHLYKTMEHYYLRGQGITGTARAMQRAESTIHAHLDQADNALREWFAAKSERDQAAKKSCTA